MGCLNNTIKPLPSVGRIGSGRWLFEAMNNIHIIPFGKNLPFI